MMLGDVIAPGMTEDSTGIEFPLCNRDTDAPLSRNDDVVVHARSPPPASDLDRTSPESKVAGCWVPGQRRVCK